MTAAAPTTSAQRDRVAVEPSADGVRTYLARSTAALAAVGIAIAVVFLPVLIVPYAFSDDYPILAIATGLGPSEWFGRSIIDSSSVNGRPIAGLLHEATFWAAGSIDNLRFVRLFGVIGIVLVAFLLHWALVRSGIGSTVAALVVLLVCTLPAWQVYAAWTVLSVGPYAALAGGIASVLVVAAVDAPRRLVLDRLVGATATLLAALLVYHPAAMFFWVFLAVALVGAVHDERRALRIVAAHVGVAIVALAGALVALEVGRHFAAGSAANLSGRSFTSDVGGNLRWFLHTPLYRALNLYDLTPSRFQAAVVAAVALVGILLLLRRERVHRPLLYVGLALALIPLSFLPSLLASIDTSYRVEVALSSLIALYVSLAAIGIWLTLRDAFVSRPRVALADRLATGAAALAVVAVAAVASRNVYTLFVKPQSTELKSIRRQVAALPDGVARVGYVQIGPYQGLSSFVLGQEFGLPSSAQPWTPEPVVLLILREEGRLGPAGSWPYVETIPYDARKPTDEPVIDVRGLEKLR